MKKILLICSLLVLAMISLVSWNYYRYSITHVDNNFNLNTFLNESYNFSETSVETDVPEWCSDIEYVDSVVIPLQENIYNIDLTSEYIELMPRHIICVDSQALGEQETLYNKSVFAKDIKIKLIEINTKLDSLEKKY